MRKMVIKEKGKTKNILHRQRMKTKIRKIKNKTRNKNGMCSRREL